ncbi:MAG: NUDIX hydrolase [Patescibacteria group bacterium]
MFDSALPPFPRDRIPNFCARCGAEVLERHRPRHPYKCAGGHLIFVSPQLVAVGIVMIERMVLMTQRGRDPKRGHWGVPSGFTEWGEDSHRTAVRELAEEVFRCSPDDLDLSLKYIGERPGTDEMSHLIFWAASLTELPRPYAEPDMDETLAVGLFDLDELPEPLAYPYQLDYIRRAYEMFAR